MNPYWLIRRAVKRLIIWIGIGPCMIEYCKVCGRRQPLVWHAPDHLWLGVHGHKDGVLCPECFDRRAVEKGYWLQWSPYVERRRHESIKLNDWHRLVGEVDKVDKERLY